MHPLGEVEIGPESSARGDAGLNSTLDSRCVQLDWMILTDLSSKLSKKGFKVARRTVAKYREQLDIPVARLRKQL